MGESSGRDEHRFGSCLKERRLAMRNTVFMIVGYSAALVLWAASGGCAIGIDVFNPGLVSALGLDPAYFQGQQGKIIVAFDNKTGSPALFSAYAADNADDLTTGINNFQVSVDPNESGNEVLDCPVDLIGFGTVTNGAVDLVTVTILGAGGTGTVSYAGQPLIAPGELDCGDLVLLTLRETGGTTFTIDVQVQKGR